MKLGTENRTKVIAAIVLMTVAVGYIVYLLVGGGGGGAPPAPTPVVSTPETGTAARPLVKGKKAPPARSLDPTLRYDC